MKTVQLIVLSSLVLVQPVLAAGPQASPETGAATGLPATERTQTTNAAAIPTAQPAADTMPAQAPASAAAPAATPAATPRPVAEEQTGFSHGSVVRSAFTTGIDNREPVDTVAELPADNERVYFFTELRDMAGQRARHRWEHNGEVMAEVEFDVKGPRWRVWSSKNFQPQWTGEWKVSVLNAADEVIAEQKLEVVPESVPTRPVEDSGAAPAVPAVPAGQ